MAEAAGYDLIVFDWDGTLMDSAAAIVRALQAACSDVGAAVPSEARARYVIGLGLDEALRHVAPDLSARDYPRLVERYRHHFLSSDHELSLFEGVSELVVELERRGRMLGVATCADECFSKPHPAMLEELMDELGVMRERTLMVGDTTHDLQMARNAGVHALAVSFGAHAEDALQAEGPLACLASPPQLVRWLLDKG